MKLPPPLQKVYDAMDALAVRERLLITGVVLALLWVLWDTMLMRPLNTLGEARKAQLASLSQQIQDMERSMELAVKSRPDDPDARNRQRLSEIQARSAELDGHLQTLTGDFVRPSEMAPLLESVLARAGNLELVKMHTLDPVASDAGNGGGGYYRRGLVVELLGGYLDALRYLQALEDLPWEFFWDSVKIEVTDHPTSRITILVHTLGYREGESGV